MNKPCLLLGLLLPAILSTTSGPRASAQEVKEPRLASPAESEEPKPSSVRYDRVEQLAILLKLTPAQKAKVKPFVDAETHKMQELRRQKLTREERRHKFDALREDTYNKIKPLLTPDQVAHWDHVRHYKPTLPKAGATPTNKVPTIPPPDESSATP